MLNEKNLKWIKTGLFLLICVVSFVLCFNKIGLEKRPSQGYDEEMWTGAGITSYNMYFKNYMRKDVKLDSWFVTYALKNGIDTATIPPAQKQWFDHATWTFGWKAPNMGKYIIGAWVTAFANQSPDPAGYFEYKNRYKNDEPTTVTFCYVPFEFVGIARVPMAIMTALIIIITFLTGWLFINYITGLVASLYLLLNSNFLDVNTAVGLDAPSIFFTSLSILLLLLWIQSLLKQEKIGITIMWAAFTGLSFGFAVSSKLNAALFGYMLVPVFIILLFSIVKHLRQGGKILDKKTQKPGDENFVQRKSNFKKQALAFMTSGLLIGGLGPFVFVQLNPQVHGDTMAYVKTIRESVDAYFTRRANDQKNKFVLKSEAGTIYGYAGPGDNYPIIDTLVTKVSFSKLENARQGKWQGINNSKSGKSSFVLFDKLEPANEVTKGDNAKTFQLLLKRNFWVSSPDRYYGTIGSLIPFKGNPIDGVLVIAGLLLLLVKAYKDFMAGGKISGALVSIVAFVVLFWGNMNFIWIDFGRYHMPIYPAMAILAGFTISMIADGINKKFILKNQSGSPQK